MDQTFGEFIREKRNEKTLRLNAFAKLVGISNVYLSYIETGKRPAPSPMILERMAGVLELSPKDKHILHYLADLSRKKADFPENVWDYLNSRPDILNVLRIAAKKNLSEEEWKKIREMIEMMVQK